MNTNKKWGQRGEWYVVVQFILFGLIFFAPLVIPTMIPWPAPLDTIGVIIGGMLAVFGGFMAVAGVLNLGKNLTAVPHPKDDAVFVAHGAYRLVRHPIYSGLIFGAVGWAFWQNSLLTLLLSLVLLLFFDIKSRREEKWLVEKYPAYPDYQRRVRKLIPLVY